MKKNIIKIAYRKIHIMLNLVLIVVIGLGAISGINASEEDVNQIASQGIIASQFRDDNSIAGNDDNYEIIQSIKMEDISVLPYIENKKNFANIEKGEPFKGEALKIWEEENEKQLKREDEKWRN